MREKGAYNQSYAFPDVGRGSCLINRQEGYPSRAAPDRRVGAAALVLQRFMVPPLPQNF